MDFPINGKAEGRILIPWEHKKYPSLSVQDTSGELMFELEGGPRRQCETMRRKPSPWRISWGWEDFLPTICSYR